MTPLYNPGGSPQRCLAQVLPVGIHYTNPNVTCDAGSATSVYSEILTPREYRHGWRVCTNHVVNRDYACNTSFEHRIHICSCCGAPFQSNEHSSTLVKGIPSWCSASSPRQFSSKCDDCLRKIITECLGESKSENKKPFNTTVNRNAHKRGFIPNTEQALRHFAVHLDLCVALALAGANYNEIDPSVAVTLFRLMWNSGHEFKSVVESALTRMVKETLKEEMAVTERMRGEAKKALAIRARWKASCQTKCDTHTNWWTIDCGRGTSMWAGLCRHPAHN